MNFQNIGILEGEKKKYKVLYRRNRGYVELTEEYIHLFHPNFMKKIMLDEIDSIDERHRNVFFSFRLKDSSIYFIGFPFEQSTGVSIAESIRDIRSLKTAKRDKNLFLDIFKLKIKESINKKE